MSIRGTGVGVGGGIKSQLFIVIMKVLIPSWKLPFSFLVFQCHFTRNTKNYIKIKLSPSTKDCFICINKSPLKIMKNAFYCLALLFMLIFAYIYKRGRGAGEGGGLLSLFFILTESFQCYLFLSFWCVCVCVFFIYSHHYISIICFSICKLAPTVFQM